MRQRRAASGQRSPDGVTARRLPPNDSSPRDWSELGRWVLAEALRRATDELGRRQAPSATPTTNPGRPEMLS